MGEKYVAYVGSYTRGKSKGITIFDVDVENAKLKKIGEAKVDNPSYIYIANNGKYLYSVADEGVAAFKIESDGNLSLINKQSINGLRPCYISSNADDTYLFTGGYHDGKLTVLKIKADGSVGRVVDEVFHTGLGNVAERNFRPHINCTRLTPDGKFLCAADLGIDQVKIYNFNENDGKVVLSDIIRCELESGPRHIIFSQDQKYAYIIFELKNNVIVYSYEDGIFTKLQTLSTLPKDSGEANAASAIKLSPDGEYLIASTAGNNCVALYKVNKETGLLTTLSALPVSGEYPKDIEFFPDGKHFMSLNNESGTITVFNVDYELGNIIMYGKPIEIDSPSCVQIKKLS